MANAELIDLIQRRPDVDGRFTSLRSISSEGNFSLVFQATDNQLGKDAVLKVLHPSQLPGVAGNDYRWRSFEREAALLEDLVGTPYVIQMVAGLSLFEDIDRYGQRLQFHYYGIELAASSVGQVLANQLWDERAKLNAFREMCESVNFIHSKGIAHRDLKPDNFLLMSNPFIPGTQSLRLADLGTAREFGPSSTAISTSYQGFPPGALSFSSPEMLASLHHIWPEVAFMSDFYSLGAILFQLFAGLPLDVRRNYPNFIGALMIATHGMKRLQQYNSVIGQFAAMYPLPSITVTRMPMAPCIPKHIDALYKAMAALDYRARLCDHSEIVQRIDACIADLP